MLTAMWNMLFWCGFVLVWTCKKEFMEFNSFKGILWNFMKFYRILVNFNIILWNFMEFGYCFIEFNRIWSNFNYFMEFYRLKMHKITENNQNVWI